LSGRATPALQHRRTAPRDALDAGGDEWQDALEPEPARPKTRQPKAAPRGAGRSAPFGTGRIHPAVRRGAIVLAGVVAVVGVAFGGYSLGAPSATPAPSAAAAANDAAFKQQVAGLMQKLAANPSDIPTLLDLGNLYYQAADYQAATTWMEKVLAIDPSQVDALLAYGAASFNLEQYQRAEKSWQQVLAIEPDNVEAYYDLGFLYFSDSPPKVDLVRQMWGKVVELAPDSSIAKTVASHLQSLDSLASGAPAASPAPTGNGAPAASPSSPAAVRSGPSTAPGG
jgi:tetratricopeptide (TPR) repeat protein